MTTATPDKATVRKNSHVEIWQIAPLLLAAGLLTIGLAMFLSGTRDIVELIQPLIVVLGGTTAALLLTFPLSQVSWALQRSLERGIRGGTSPEEMLRTMLKVCEISRRDGLLGVAELRSSHVQVEEACALIGDAADETEIDNDLSAWIAAEERQHRMSADVFLFTGIYASITGLLGSLILFVRPEETATLGQLVWLPLICGLCLALLMAMLIGRLRAAHQREQLTAEIAFRSAAWILEDNNVQRLKGRLAGMLAGAGY